MKRIASTLLAFALLAISQPSVARSEPNPTSASPALQLQNQALARLYESIPNQKTGSGVASHLRRIQQAANNEKSPTFEVVKSPTVNKIQVDRSVTAYEQAMKIWQPLGLNKLNLTWVFMSEKDYHWWKQRVKKYETENPDTKVWNPKTGIIGHCKLSPISYCGYGNPKPSGKTFQYNVIGSRYSSSPNMNTVNHEAVHFYQDSIDTLLMQKTPCWFVEGQANLIGNVFDNPANLARNRLHQIDHVTKNIPNSRKYSAKRWLKELKELDGPKRDICMQKELSYSVGMFVFESLYSNHSFKQIHELVIETSKSGSFAEAISTVLDTSKEELYEDIASYLSKQF